MPFFVGEINTRVFKTKKPLEPSKRPLAAGHSPAMASILHRLANLETSHRCIPTFPSSARACALLLDTPIILASFATTRRQRYTYIFIRSYKNYFIEKHWENKDHTYPMEFCFTRQHSRRNWKHFAYSRSSRAPLPLCPITSLNSILSRSCFFGNVQTS